jgi:hypothetical protein
MSMAPYLVYLRGKYGKLYRLAHVPEKWEPVFR